MTGHALIMRGRSFLEPTSLLSQFLQATIVAMFGFLFDFLGLPAAVLAPTLIVVAVLAVVLTRSLRMPGFK